MTAAILLFTGVFRVRAPEPAPRPFVRITITCSAVRLRQ